MTYKDKEIAHQIKLIEGTNIFDGCSGGAKYRGKGDDIDYLLKESIYNLYRPIRNIAIKYFNGNGWWNGKEPTNDTVSSQIACINHLMPIMDDKNAVLALINGIKDEFTDIIPITFENEPHYIAFEVTYKNTLINAKTSTKGAFVTSIDALINAKHKSGKNILIPIEWKYTESYSYQKEEVYERTKYKLDIYKKLIEESKNTTILKDCDDKLSGIYNNDPFYQLMRQTLFAEQIILHKDSVILNADDFLHINVIPKHNTELLGNYKVSGKSLEATWRSCLKDQSKYQIIDPSDLFEPLKGNEKYKDLIAYLEKRYWNDSI